MRKIFGKQRWNKILSVVLVMALVAGTVGMNEMFVKAEDVVYPAGVPTVATAGFNGGGSSATYADVEEEGVQRGVKLSFAADSYQRAYSRWNKRDLSEGYRVDIEDFEFAENESMIFVMGPNYTDRGDYIETTVGTYGILYEDDGDFVVMSATVGNSLMSGGAVCSATTLAAQSEIDKLSIYIKSDGKKWDIVVNTYKDGVKVGETYTTSIATTDTETNFNFGAVGYATITDATTATTDIITGWTNKSAASYMVSYIGIPVQSISLNTSTLTLSKGTTSALQATISPTTAANQAVSWSSSDNNIATVDANGNVTAVAEGVATITAISSEDGTKKATCEVKVVKSNISADNFTANKSKMTYANAEDGAGVKVVYSTEAASWERIATKNTYSVKDKLQIQIDDIQATDVNYSIVIAIGDAPDQWYDKAGYMLLIGKSGKVAIVESSSTVQSPNNQTTIATGTMNELNEDISLVISQSDSNYIIEVNGTAYTIPNATSVLASGGEHYLAFGVMSDFVITDGDVSDVKYYHDGATIGRTQDVSFVIRNITVASTGVSLDKEYINLFVEENTALTATVSPLTVSQSVNWTSADKTIATVDENGQVTAIKAGTTIITATSKTDAGMSASCVVRVTAPKEYLKKAHLATNQIGDGTTTTIEDVDKGLKVSFVAGSQVFHRVETKWNGDEATNYTEKYNGYWPEGNGVHIGFQDIALENDADMLAVFIGKRLYPDYMSSWYNTDAYMLFYGKDGSFAIVETYNSWSNNYIEKVLIAEKREPLTDRLSLDVREEDGRYELLVNGKAYSLPAEREECPIPRTSSTDRLHFAFGLMTGFKVTEEGVMTAPSIKSGPNYNSNGSFTVTDISYITTEELVTADYVQRTSLTNLDGDYVLGKNELAATTVFGATDFNGTLDDSCEGLMWEITSVDGGYSVKKAGGDENSYLNISSTGVSLGAMQTLTIERSSNTTTSYFTISNGTNYLNLTESGISASTSADKLILYNVRPELVEATEEKPLFTLSTFSDLHGEWVYDSDEKYIRDGIVEATKKVREEDNANIIAFLGDLISDKNSDTTDAPDGYWYAQGSGNVEKEWQTARDKMYAAAESATESGRALYLAGNHEYAIGGIRANPTFNSGDYTDGIERKLPELTTENAYFQQTFPEGTTEDIVNAGHVLSYHYNIDGMDIVAINPSYTGAEITEGFSYDLDALDWMDAKLEEIGKDKTVLVLGHYPTTSLNNEKGGLESYNKIKKIFAEYPNVIYVYGHDHNPYIHTDTYQRVQTFAADGVTPFQDRYETPTGYTEIFGGSVAFANDVGLASSDLAGTPAVVQGLLVKVYSDRIVLQMKNYNESPLGVDALREYTIMRDVALNVAENPQEAEVEEYTTAFENFRSGEEKKAPVAPKGYVFAGWYYDEACTQPVAVGATTVAEDKQIFANFLPESVLSVQAQSRYSMTDDETIDDSKIDLRLVTMVDDLKYKEVGFLVTNRSGKVKRYSEHYAFWDLTAAGYNYKPGYFNDCCTRFITINMVNIPISGTGFTADREIPVQAYWITQDGTTVYGPARTIKVSTAVANVGNAN